MNGPRNLHFQEQRKRRWRDGRKETRKGEVGGGKLQNVLLLSVQSSKRIGASEKNWSWGEAGPSNAAFSGVKSLGESSGWRVLKEDTFSELRVADPGGGSRLPVNEDGTFSVLWFLGLDLDMKRQRITGVRWESLGKGLGKWAVDRAVKR